MSNTTFFPGFDQFASNFVYHENLSADFNKRRPVGPATGKTFWFKRDSNAISPNQSVNDVLRAFLREHNIPYINTFNGDVWFIYNNAWHNCEWTSDIGEIKFYMLEYELG